MRVKKRGDVIVAFVMTNDEFRRLRESYDGICVKCGDVSEDVEPDARDYECPDCGSESVCGIEALLIDGLIELT